MLSVAVCANDELCFQTNFRGLTKILGFVKSSAQKVYDILKPCEVVLQPKALYDKQSRLEFWKYNS